MRRAQTLPVHSLALATRATVATAPHAPTLTNAQLAHTTAMLEPRAATMLARSRARATLATLATV